jgi:hypothetical protein
MRGQRNLYQPGNQYGKLTLIRAWTEQTINRKSKETICECKCECGECVVVRGRYLRAGHKLSCGCLRHTNNKNHHAWKGYGEISRSDWNDIQRGAKGRVIPFDLTIEQAWELFVAQNRRCVLSGVPIKFSTRNRRYENNEHTASLDRVDSTKGYTLDNVQWVHKIVQTMKWQSSQNEFIGWCRLISNNCL